MKKITEEEASQLLLQPKGRGTPVRTALLALKVGEYLLIEKKDWHWKTQTPVTYCRRLEENHKVKFECHRIADGSGYLAKRIS